MSPHGAYLGIASLVAVGVMGPERRALAVGRVMLGLTVATIVGVPLTSEFSQWAGRRGGFAIVAARSPCSPPSPCACSPRTSR